MVFGSPAIVLSSVERDRGNGANSTRGKGCWTVGPAIFIMLEFALDLLQTFSVDLKNPAPEELRKLRTMARNSFEKSLPDDELACWIVRRELSRRARPVDFLTASRAAA